MRERMPNLIAVILLSILVVGTWWAAEYTQKSVPIDPPARMTHEPDSWAYNFVMIQTDNSGKANSRLEGINMRHYPDDDSYEVDDAISTGQQPDSPVTIGTSDIAIMDSDGTRIIMRGNARVHRLPDETRAPLEVTSAELVMYPNEDIVETSHPARVVNGNHVLLGTGMHYNNQTRQLQVFSASDATLSGKKSKATVSDN